MEKIQILGIGRDPVVLQKLLRFINENPKWEGTGTVDDESAIEVFHQRKYDIILLIDPLEESSIKKFHSVFSFNDPDILFINHTGDSSAILSDEIHEALDKKRSNIHVVDDVFKKE